MTSLLRSHRLLIPATLLIAAFLSLPRLADAQDLSVESTSIDNGAVNVPTTVDISVTFSKALATSGFPDVDLSLLGLDLALLEDGCAALPALIAITPGTCPESWELTNGGRTLDLKNVLLAENQVHTMIVLFAVSADGDVLTTPHVTRFSTSDSIPQGSVSGQVTSSGLDVTGSLILLTGSDVLGLLSSSDSTSLDPLIGFADESGNYSISFAPDGDYFTMALQFDLSILEEVLAPASKVALEGLGVGLHDKDSDGIADLVSIASGGAMTDVNIVLSAEGATIKDLQGPIEGIIAADFPDARVSFGAGAGLERDGSGLVWVYIFTDLVSGQGWLSAGIGQVAFPPTRIDENEDIGSIALLLGTAVFTDYADSDQAMEWFLAAGGQEFLEANPEAIGAGIVMDRLLFDLLLEAIQGGGLSFVPGLDVWSEVLRFDQITNKLAGVFSKQQALEAWVIVFLGPDSDLGLHLVVAADDGTPLLVIGSSPAEANVGHADAAASAWQGDAVLVGIDALELPVSSDGNSVAWSFSYYSATEDSVLNVMVSGGAIGGVMTQEVVPVEDVHSTDTLISEWIDSPEAIGAADQIAAGFLASNTGVVTTATLAMGLQLDHPDRGIWRVVYSGNADDGSPTELVVDIDASSGVYVAVETDRTVPNTFALDQNYPNPFNPETVIAYQVGQTGDVNLSVFNLLGQKVRVLVNGRMTEGAYTVRWDARDSAGKVVPSGVYLYRLEANETIETRRMTLVR